MNSINSCPISRKFGFYLDKRYYCDNTMKYSNSLISNTPNNCIITSLTK